MKDFTQHVLYRLDSYMSTFIIECLGQLDGIKLMNELEDAMEFNHHYTHLTSEVYNGYETQSNGWVEYKRYGIYIAFGWESNNTHGTIFTESDYEDTNISFYF